MGEPTPLQQALLERYPLTFLARLPIAARHNIFRRADEIVAQREAAHEQEAPSGD